MPRRCFLPLATVMLTFAFQGPAGTFAFQGPPGDTDPMQEWMPTLPPGPTAPTAAFRFATAVGNGMVLAAAPKPALVWGFCEQGAAVEVVFRGESIRAIVGPDHATGTQTTWRALLPATLASFDKHSLNVTSGGMTITLADFMFGEVWVCSGQSNMQYPLGDAACWNASNVNCTDRRAAQCNFGCTADVNGLPLQHGTRLLAELLTPRSPPCFVRLAPRSPRWRHSTRASASSRCIAPPASRRDQTWAAAAGSCPQRWAAASRRRAGSTGATSTRRSRPKSRSV